MHASNWRGRIHHMALALLTVGAVLCTTPAATAETLSATFFRIDVQSTLGTEYWQVLSTNPSINYNPGTGTWSWSTGLHTLGSVASLNQANMTIVGDDPQIALGFTVTAGEVDVTATITTATLSFDSTFNPDGAASAGVTLTRNGEEHLATLTGTGYNGSAFTAYYNGTPWDESPYLPYLETTTSGSISDNTGGYIAIPGTVTSVQTQFSFDVSAGDQASGTSNYLTVRIPEPASFALLALGGLVLRRRRG